MSEETLRIFQDLRKKRYGNTHSDWQRPKRTLREILTEKKETCDFCGGLINRHLRKNKSPFINFCSVGCK